MVVQLGILYGTEINQCVRLEVVEPLAIQQILENSHQFILFVVQDVLQKQFEISPHILVTSIVYFDFLCCIQQSKMRGRHHNKKALFTNIH